MYDAVVIGAGLSGLQAAYSLQQAGRSVVVLEARDRVEGKVWSEPTASGHGVADLGAAWINENRQPRVAAYARQFNLRKVPQRLTGTAIMQISREERSEFPFGIMPNFEPHEKKDLERIRDHIQAKCMEKVRPTAEDDGVSLAQYVHDLGALPKTQRMVNLWSRVMHGVESSEQSAAWFIDYCRRNCGLLAIRADDETGGNYQRIISGTQAFPKGLANLVGASNIHLSSPVTSISNQSNQVSVQTKNGKSFSARKCILSIPAAMYKTLSFTPALPRRLQEIAYNSCLGNYNKMILVYAKPWWRDLGYNGFLLSYDWPVCVARDTSVDENGFYTLTCFVNGQNGRDWAKLYSHQRRKVVLDQLAHAFKQGKKDELYRPVECFDQIWTHEEFSQGALASVTKLGHYTEYADVYGKPVGNLHFVGTEYSPEWKGYMEGALCSGELGAKEVVDALTEQKQEKARL